MNRPIFDDSRQPHQVVQLDGEQIFLGTKQFPDRARAQSFCNSLNATHSTTLSWPVSRTTALVIARLLQQKGVK